MRRFDDAAAGPFGVYYACERAPAEGAPFVGCYLAEFSSAFTPPPVPRSFTAGSVPSCDSRYSPPDR